MTTYTPASARSLAQRLTPIARSARAYYALTKPRVVSLIVLTAVIGMFLATPGMVPPLLLVAATAGIALGVAFLAHAIAIYLAYSDALARRTFRFSITYLAALFAALLVDHYLAR